MEPSSRLRWQHFASLVIGIWLGFSPWLLGFFDDVPVATWNALVSGTVVIVVAAVDIEQPAAWGKWLLALVGVWLALSPVTLGFGYDWIASAVAIVTGATMFVIAGGALLATVSAGRQRLHGRR